MNDYTYLKDLINKEWKEEEKKNFRELNIKDLSKYLKKVGYIKFQKNLTKDLFEVLQLLGNNSSNEDVLLYIDNLELKQEILKYQHNENLIYELGKCFYTFYTFEHSELFNNLFDRKFTDEKFLENIKETDFYNKNKTILEMKKDVINFLSEEVRNEIECFEDGYGYEYDEDDEPEEYEEHQETLSYISYLVKKKYIE